MEERRTWIPMSDGARLAARLFLPDELPAAVLLEALPYRMDDLTASYDSECRRLCEEGGFAVCRLDLRGTGSSTGIALDEYHPQEQADVCEAIAWLAAQEWSTGRVGMYGTSWGGFNSIQVAMERPPALGAIAPIYASDDRYTDDVHYMGGALKALDLVDWVLYMAACNVLPPVPEVFGDGWRDEWRRRIDGTEPWLLRWLEEQVDGPYWRHGSLRPRYERILCPTMIVAGWADGYTNIAFRALDGLRCPHRVLVGPWSHMSPATSVPGPHIDLVPELVRWFARWLRDERNGVDEEPPLVYFARRSTRPAPELPEVNGKWRAEPVWPPARLREVVLRPEGNGTDLVAVEGDVGTSAWISCAGKPPWVLPDDQREDDARSLVYEWDAGELELLGHPRVRLAVTAPAPVAYVSAKLCDLFPDGTSALVTRGILNLTHRNGHDAPEPVEPGVPIEVEIELEATSWIFESRPSPPALACGDRLAERVAAAVRGHARDRPRVRRAHAAGARRPARRAGARASASSAEGDRRRRGPAGRLAHRARRERDAGGDELRVRLRRRVRREDRGPLRRDGRCLARRPGAGLGARLRPLPHRVA